MREITTAFLTLTHQCCCRCKYCFVDQNSERMSYETAKQSAKWLWENYKRSDKHNKPSIIFFGGEPLLCYDEIIKPLTEYIRSSYGDTFDLSITTNGILYDEGKLQFLTQNGVRMMLSMDGGKNMQDINRPMADGSSSFDQIYPKISLIMKYYPKLQMRSTITPESAGYLYDSICFAKDNGFDSIIIRPNEYDDWSDSINILQNEIHKCGDYIIDSCRKGIIPIAISSFESTFEGIRRINQAIEEDFNKKLCGGQCGNCGLGINGCVGIGPDGTIYSCQNVSSMSDDIKDIFNIGNVWNSIDEDKRTRLKNRFDCSKVIGDVCNECRFARICRGQCVLENLIVNKDMNYSTSIGCIWEQLWLEEGIKVMQALGNENNEIFKSLWDRKRWVNATTI